MIAIISGTVVISNLADIEVSVRGTIMKTSHGFVIESFIKFKPAGGSFSILIGIILTINSGCVVSMGNGITIGYSVVILENCVFAPITHIHRAKELLIIDQSFAPSKGGIIIEDDLCIGAGYVLLDGYVVGRGAVIGAMSLVRSYVPRYTMAAGNPLVFQGQRS